MADLDTTGWKVYLYPHVHQKALIEAARRLLPEGVGVSGKASLSQESRTLTLTCSGSLPAGERGRHPAAVLPRNWLDIGSPDTG